ncbi:MAG: hypothetical protein HY078_01290 [Elusimicrobia bacterium]|nr:hypothetical protein [Elusimicrobiota bacterium]
MNNSRGQSLATTLVMLTVVMMVTTMITRVMLNRYTMTTRTTSSMRGKFLSQSAQHQTYACLEGSMFGQTTCNIDDPQFAAIKGCLPKTVGGKDVTVTFSGTPPLCKMTITVADK